MNVPRIRKLLTFVDPVRDKTNQMGEPRRAVALAVIDNPYSVRHSEDLSLLSAMGEELAGLLGLRASTALGIAVTQVASYGKAAIVGMSGDLEHATALLHPHLRGPSRAHRAANSALVPSARRVGDLGTRIDIPLGRKQVNAYAQRFDVVSVHVRDAPYPHEIVIAVAVSDQALAPPCAAGDNVVSFYSATRRSSPRRLSSIR